MKSILVKGKIIPGLAALVIFLAAPAVAGPPFASDDPGTMPYLTGEVYLFANGGHASEGTSFNAAPGIEIDFSLLRKTFLHLVVPLAFDNPSHGPTAHGLGDIELGFAWQFMSQSHGRPDISFSPLFELPTGKEDRGLGSGEVQVFFPLWFERDTGPWAMYGGGGYWINPGTDNKNWWYTGVVVERQLTDRLFLGGEIFHQTPDVVGGSSSTGFNIGGGFTVAPPYQILFSAGRNMNHVGENLFSFYAALYRTF
jgi:hypothetical protein